MMDDNSVSQEDLGTTGEITAPTPKELSPAAQRALAEAQARRAEYDRVQAEMPKERGGRGGQDPVRYGDWEKKGLTSDF